MPYEDNANYSEEVWESAVEDFLEAIDKILPDDPDYPDCRMMVEDMLGQISLKIGGS